MFGKIDGFTGCGIAGFLGENRGDSCDSGAINSGGVIGLLPFTPSQIIGGYLRDRLRSRPVTGIVFK